MRDPLRLLPSNCCKPMAIIKEDTIIILRCSVEDWEYVGSMVGNALGVWLGRGTLKRSTVVFGLSCLGVYTYLFTHH